MKYLILFLITVNANAASYVSETDLTKCNTQTPPYTFHTSLGVCLEKSGEQCYQLDNKNCRTHKVQGNSLVEDATLKTAHDASEAAKLAEKSRRKGKRDAGDACLKAIADPDALLPNDVLPTLKCVIKLLDRE